MSSQDVNGWPELPYAAWKDTRDTLHLWTQIVGKVRLAQTPWLNHSWHVALYVTARGLTTSPIPYRGRALQIDFDARQSERAWYAAFLRELRSRISSTLPLTITALEHWCEDGAWISSLPVTDATPMLFRMGPEDRPAPDGFAPGVCQASVGVSTDELPVRIPRARRIYFFHPGPWTQEAYDAAVAQAARWRK